jgi:glycosyltransferase involved in cell wall biosynthesis
MTIRFGFVSTYPPTICGLATFTSSLYSELITSSGHDGVVIRLVDSPAPPAGEEVAGDMIAGNSASAYRAADLLNEGDIAIVQHEYGVYGGPDGDEVLRLLDALTVPSVVVLHTVLSAPTTHQREVLEAVAASASAVVTMTATARDRLANGYAVDMGKVSVIPHGAPPVRDHGLSVHHDRPTVLTWGLIGPGKGIEWGIEAMARLTDLSPAPRYIVAGQTHPKVLVREGEAYRGRLKAQAERLGVAANVTFDSRYRDNAALGELVDAADVVLLPYDSTDQVTSGVLIEAVAALKPVIATRFPHAVELLGDGAGLLVQQRNSAEMAAALRTLLTQPAMTAGMARAAVATTPELLWPAVAQRYLELGLQLMNARVAA